MYQCDAVYLLRFNSVFSSIACRGQRRALRTLAIALRQFHGEFFFTFCLHQGVPFLGYVGRVTMGVFHFLIFNVKTATTAAVYLPRQPLKMVT